MQVDTDRAFETARCMLGQYSTAAIASEMAHWHAMDYGRETEGRAYWKLVGRIIRQLSKGE